MVSRFVLLHPEVLLKVKDASFKVFDLLRTSEPCISVDLLLKLVNLLDQKEAALNVREVVEGLDKVKDVVIGVLGSIDVKEKQLFYVSELGLFFDEVFENELVLLKTHVQEVDCFEDLVNLFLNI